MKITDVCWHPGLNICAWIWEYVMIFIVLVNSYLVLQFAFSIGWLQSVWPIGRQWALNNNNYTITNADSNIAFISQRLNKGAREKKWLLMNFESCKAAFVRPQNKTFRAGNELDRSPLTRMLSLPNWWMKIWYTERKNPTLLSGQSDIYLCSVL